MKPVKQRVLHVFSSCERGGVQLRTCELLPELGEQLEHIVVGLDGDPGAARALPGGERWHASESLAKAGSLRTTLRLRKLLRRWRPQLIASYDWGSLDSVAANLSSLRTRHLHHEDGIAADELGGFKTRRILARRLLLRAVDRVVVPSHALEEIAREQWRVAEQKLTRIANGVDTRRFRTADGRQLRARFHLRDDQLCLGIVARLDVIKNVRRALDAFALLAGASLPCLFVLGEGPLRTALEAHAQSLGIADRVHWLGFQADPAVVLRDLDVLLLSSDHEELPRALLEAMACGCAVVATDVGDVAQALPSVQRPFVVARHGPDTSAKLAERLQQLMLDCHLREQLARANRARVLEAYDRASMLQAYRQVYAEVLAQDPEQHGPSGGARPSRAGAG